MKGLLDKKKSKVALWKTLSREWRQATDWEKIFVKDTSHKGILSKICKELLKLNSEKTTQLENA